MNRIAICLSLVCLLWISTAGAQEQSSSETAVIGLDLQAVGELFKDAKDLEAFEKALNDPEVGINNLDLDEDGKVDFIKYKPRTSTRVTRSVRVQRGPAGTRASATVTKQKKSGGGKTTTVNKGASVKRNKRQEKQP